MTELNILTYNVLHETIKDENYLNKVERDFKEIIKKYNTLDIVGIQENQNCNNIHNITGLEKMRMINCQIGKTNILTFLNPAIEVLGFAWDSFEYYDNKLKKTKKTKKGRPFHIIIAKYKDKDFIFINCHFPHIRKKDEVKKVITKKLTTVLTNYHLGYIIPEQEKNQLKFNIEPNKLPNGNLHGTKLNGNKIKTEAIVSLLDNKNYHVVMLGDFNDNGNIKLYQNFQPFDVDSNKFLNMSQYTYLNNIVLRCDNPPPKSCCFGIQKKKNIITGFEGNINQTGDYIMVNRVLNIKKPNEIPISNRKAEIAGSDHLPVFMKVSFENEKKESKKGEKSVKKESKKGKNNNVSKNSLKSKFTCQEIKYELTHKKKQTKKKK